MSVTEDALKFFQCSKLLVKVYALVFYVKLVPFRE